MVDHTSVRWTSSRTYDVVPTAARFEMWESSISGRAGLAAACDFVREEVGVATAFVPPSVGPARSAPGARARPSAA